ncbi:hypothetical protein A9B99_21990 [Mangrovibacter phragmitis]|uniref:Uncharacterized protein n=1 Tax=Mangrovibacter phragmitis TaxID=1691903 RepID=A0A1B7L568_9ENTR|nr:hypothetical protein [Mangrovibacter phragmitis]OAT77415.1 hypothetical protein A9B99_21990 [Mangrovibacter phragmitis]
MTWNDIIITDSIWPPVLYYTVSIIVGILLYIGKLFVHRYANLTVYVCYALFVTLFSGIQVCIFRFGGDFTNAIFGIDLDTLAYKSIYNGAFVFFLLYGIAIPTRFK